MPWLQFSWYKLRLAKYVSLYFHYARVLAVPDVQNVLVVACSETELTLQWYNENSNYSYILRGSHGNQHIHSSEYLGGVLTHTVSSLSPGTEYTFTVFTVFDGTQSSGYSFTTVTSEVTSLSFPIRCSCCFGYLTFMLSVFQGHQMLNMSVHGEGVNL